MEDEILETENSTDSSSEETSSEIVTEDVKKPEPKTVPYERFKQVNDKLKALRELSSNEETPAPVRETNKTPIDDKWKQWTEFAIENRELDREQFAIAKRLFESGVPTSKVLEDPLYVAASEKYLREKADKDASPTSSRSPKGANGKPIEEMTPEEHKAYFEKRIGKN